MFLVIEYIISWDQIFPISLNVRPNLNKQFEDKFCNYCLLVLPIKFNESLKNSNIVKRKGLTYRALKLLMNIYTQTILPTTLALPLYRVVTAAWSSSEICRTYCTMYSVYGCEPRVYPLQSLIAIPICSFQSGTVSQIYVADHSNLVWVLCTNYQYRCKNIWQSLITRVPLPLTHGKKRGLDKNTGAHRFI